jgi:sigma-B regulation protein RsbU (phosphoserine phosphatase)
MPEIAAKLVLLAVLLLCVLIAVYMALRRPYDRRALAAFALLLSLSQVISITGWQSFPRFLWGFAKVWPVACAFNWSFGITAFGLYFPEQFRWDRKRPGLKWLYLGPVICVAIAGTFVSATPQFSFSEYRAMLSGAGKLALVAGPILTAISITIFFICISIKKAQAQNRDLKRRLRLLEVAAAAGLGPIGIFLLYLVISKANAQELETPLLVLAVWFLVFPLTLAYTVLTERAMELRVVIRQGMRYALARGGLRIIIFLVMALFYSWLMIFLWSKPMREPNRITILAGTIFIFVILIRRVRSHAYEVIDKKFFREHYEAEAVLSDLSENVRTIVDEKQLFETVTRCVSNALHISHSCVLVNNDGLLRPVFATGLAIPERAELSESGKTVSVVAESKEPPPVYFERHDNWVHTTPEHELLTLKALGAQLLLPLKSKDRILGLLCLGPKLSEEPFSRTDINVLRSIALQTGLALENSRLTAAVAQEIAQRERLNREIEIAREVQERLFPQRLPLIAGIDYSGACRPALGVGGDYYDFLGLPNGDLGIAIGDVSGKGIAAALLMASLQASLRSQALTGANNLADLMTPVNRLIYEATPPNRYATFFYGQYSRQTRTFRYVNAGHNPPFVLRKGSDGTIHVIRLDTGGPVIGLFLEAVYQQGSLTLETGDIFVAFTDGISEAMNGADEEWGEEHLIPAAATHIDKPAAEMIPQLMADADRFADGAPQHDDMTLVVLKVQSEVVPAVA